MLYSGLGMDYSFEGNQINRFIRQRRNGMENNGENSGPLTSLPDDRLTATDCNADRSCRHDRHANAMKIFPIWVSSIAYLTIMGKVSGHPWKGE